MLEQSEQRVDDEELDQVRVQLDESAVDHQIERAGRQEGVHALEGTARVLLVRQSPQQGVVEGEAPAGCRSIRRRPRAQRLDQPGIARERSQHRSECPKGVRKSGPYWST